MDLTLSRTIVGEALSRHCISSLWLHFLCSICSPSAAGSWISVWSFLCTCNAWVFRCLFFSSSFYLVQRKLSFYKDTKGSASAISKISLFSCRLEVQSVCSSVYMCGWWLHFRISKTVIAFTFFPNKLVQYEFSLLKDLDSTWNRGLHV